MVSVNQIRSVGELASAGYRQLKGLSQDGCQVFLRECRRPFQYAPKQFSTEGSSYIKVKDGNIVSSFCKKTMDFPSCIDGRQQHHFHLTKYDEYGNVIYEGCYLDSFEKDYPREDQGDERTYTIGLRDNFKLTIQGNDVVYEDRSDEDNKIRICGNLIREDLVLSKWNDDIRDYEVCKEVILYNKTIDLNDEGDR